MSELERFRDHCRAMADREHKPECSSITAREPYWSAWALAADGQSMSWLGPKPKWERPTCAGCNPAVDRALFVRLADEVDAYLTNDDAPLWEDA